MKYERRTNSDGSHYYRFTYYDSKAKKPKHLTRVEIRKRFGKDILTVEEAKECIKLLSAKFETEKIRIQRRLTWESEFYSFANLLEDYAKKQKKRAPNSWQNNVFYLKHYVPESVESPQQSSSHPQFLFFEFSDAVNNGRRHTCA